MRHTVFVKSCLTPGDLLKDFRRLFVASAVALMLWIVPSQVSHGMDTGGQGAAHVDQGLFGYDLPIANVRKMIHRGDGQVETALQ